MRCFVALLVVLLSFSEIVMCTDHVPTNRAELKSGDWFPYVISKIAPLESWIIEPAAANTKVSNQSRNDSYQEYRNKYWGDVPRFCFSFFRPTPERFAAFRAAMENYRGPVFWAYSDSCIAPFPRKPGYISPMITDPGSADMSELLEKFEELQRNPPKPDPEFVKKAVTDILPFCLYLEEKLGLKDKEPQQFDSSWLTKDGLSKHPEADEDFIEYGSWSVALASDPEKLSQPNVPQSTTAQYLHFGIGEQESASILEELGVNWEKYREAGDMGQVASDYPRLSLLIDETDDITFSPKEAEALLNECLRAQESVKKPQSIRGLDKLIRIARIAENSKLGIYFGGQ